MRPRAPRPGRPEDDAAIPLGGRARGGRCLAPAGRGGKSGGPQRPRQPRGPRLRRGRRPPLGHLPLHAEAAVPRSLPAPGSSGGGPVEARRDRYDPPPGRPLRREPLAARRGGARGELSVRASGHGRAGRVRRKGRVPAHRDRRGARARIPVRRRRAVGEPRERPPGRAVAFGCLSAAPARGVARPARPDLRGEDAQRARRAVAAAGGRGVAPVRPGGAGLRRHCEAGVRGPRRDGRVGSVARLIGRRGRAAAPARGLRTRGARAPPRRDRPRGHGPRTRGGLGAGDPPALHRPSRRPSPHAGTRRGDAGRRADLRPPRVAYAPLRRVRAPAGGRRARGRRGAPPAVP